MSYLCGVVVYVFASFLCDGCNNVSACVFQRDWDSVVPIGQCQTALTDSLVPIKGMSNLVQFSLHVHAPPNVHAGKIESSWTFL